MRKEQPTKEGRDEERYSKNVLFAKAWAKQEEEWRRSLDSHDVDKAWQILSTLAEEIVLDPEQKKNSVEAP